MSHPLLADLETSADLPALLHSAYLVFEEIRQVALDAADGETHGAGALVLAAEAAADGRDAVLSAASLPRESLAQPGATASDHSSQPARRDGGYLVALSSELARHLANPRMTGAVPADRVACRRAALCALEIQALIEGGGT